MRFLADKMNKCIVNNKYDDALSAWLVYEGFDKMLKILSAKAGTCKGCRATATACPDCPIRHCCLFTKKLDFCYQCSDFPCQKFSEHDKSNHGRCLNNLSEIRKIGLAQWLKQKETAKTAHI